MGAHAVSEADHATVAPLKSRSDVEAAIHPIPQKTVAAYLEYVDQVHVFDEYEGQNDTLKALLSSADKALVVGTRCEVNMGSDELFGEGFDDGPFTVHEAAIVSADAFAMRLCLDLSELKDGEAVWVIDPTGPRAFGPYTRADHKEGGRWLPTTDGEMAVLMVRSLSDSVPQVRVLSLSHFFRKLNEAEEKVLSCNINIACEGAAAIQSVSSGVGVLLVPWTDGYTRSCSGTLINNPTTANLEPYFLSSWHCIESMTGASDVDVYWDYRASACGTNDPPAFASLPHSSGDVLLKSSNTYDAALFRLDSVPGGSFGRTYVGWTTRDPVVNEAITGIHFPGGDHMRISYGTVKTLDEYSNGFEKQTKVHWDQGVTEGGSSGNALLLVSDGYKITGTLSNGYSHSCSSTTFNIDWYSSFRDFFPSVQNFLEGDSSQAPQGDKGSQSLCPAETAFKDNPEVLDNLRTFRDKGLQQTDLGKNVVKAYYAAAPFLADRVEKPSPTRKAFVVGASVFAAVGGAME
jgi:lysyl endopeptidase